jgi:hypothetical protein
MTRKVLIATALAVSAGVAFGAESPWAGTWNLDAAHSRLAGDTFEISKGPGALLHYADGVTAYDFGTDGKEYHAAYDRTTAWTKDGPNAWTEVSRRNGKTIATARHSLSADGKTQTLHHTGTHPDGKPIDDENLYTRVSGGPGLLGKWKSVKVGSSGAPQSFVISSPAPGVLHYELPEMQAHTEGAADGTDRPITGGNLPVGMTIALKLVSPTQIKYVMKVNGKEDNQGTQTLAANGRSFTDVNWSPGKEDEKITSLYVKQ